MTKINETLDRFQSAASAAGYELVTESEFWRYYPEFYAHKKPPVSAERDPVTVEKLLDHGLGRAGFAICPEYRAVITRWNGLSLFRLGETKVPNLFAEQYLKSIETAILEHAQTARELSHTDFDHVDYGNCFEVFGFELGRGVGFYSKAMPKFEMFQFDEVEGRMKIFSSIRFMFDCFADALEQNVPLVNLNSLERIEAHARGFALIAQRRQPWIDYWFGYDGQPPSDRSV